MNRFIANKISVNTYEYLNKFMTREEFEKKLGKVKLKSPLNPIAQGEFPHVYLPSTNGNLISIAEIAMNKNVVLFYYPGDKEGLKYPELAGCTPEACQFKNSFNEFERLNTQIFGVSFQTTERQCQFIKTADLNFVLLSDSEHLLASKLGLPYWEFKAKENEENKLFPSRQTYIIKRGNIIAKIFEKVDPKGHIAEVFDELKNIEKTPTPY